MRILNWVQAKLNGKPEKKRANASFALAHSSDAGKEEFRDWPQTLLTIGTFGNNELKEDSQRHELSPSQSSKSSRDLSDFSPEDVTKLQKELTKLLALKPKPSTDGSEKGGGDRANLPLNRFLNCPSSLEVDRTSCPKFCDDLGNEDDGSLSPNTKIILNKAKDMLADNCNGIRKRSISFLLKKLFVCHSGFAPAPSLRDPLPESRMEKILRTILHSKIYSQSSAPMSMKYLEKKPTEKLRVEERKEEKGEDGSKWVKTDSDYIVLEI